MTRKKRLLYQDGRRLTGNAAFKNCPICTSMDQSFLHAFLR